MSKHDEQNVKRHRVTANGQKHYVTVGKTDIMVHSPNEGDLANQEIYSLREAVCRIISKARKEKLSWDVVIEQLEKASGRNNTVWAGRLAAVLREN